MLDAVVDAMVEDPTVEVELLELEWCQSKSSSTLPRQMPLVGFESKIPKRHTHLLALAAAASAAAASRDLADANDPPTPPPITAAIISNAAINTRKKVRRLSPNILLSASPLKLLLFAAVDASHGVTGVVAAVSE